jgi:hypothetical protein
VKVQTSILLHNEHKMPLPRYSQQSVAQQLLELLQVQLQQAL